MKKMKFTVLLLCGALLLGSCGTMNNKAKGGIIGGGSGAAAGAIIGGLIGKGKGAAIGAAVGVPALPSDTRWTRRLPKLPRLKAPKWSR